jgi:tripartite ATP-independent transporter DctM subunit
MFGSLIVLLLAGLPVAFATGSLAVIFISLIWSPDALMTISLRIWQNMYQYLLFAIPLFIFLASMLQQAGIVEDMYETIREWTGAMRGGLAIATVIASTLLAAIVGIIGAAVVTMGLIALPSMLEHKYNKNLAMGSVMAGGTLGILIPPSILFILYALVAGTSAGKLFAGGIFPGLVLSAIYSIYILIRCYIDPTMGPGLSKEERAQITWGIKFRHAARISFPVGLVILVLGSIFFGIASITEAAGVGAFGAIVAAALRGKLTLKGLKEASYQTAKITAMVLWTIFGALSLVTFYIAIGGDEFVTGIVLDLGFGKWGTFWLIMVVLIFLGMFLDWVGIMYLAVPIFLPVIKGFGFDLLWFGIVYNVNMQMSFLSPPFGYALFYLKGVAPKDITMWEIIKSALPFLGLQFVGLIIVVLYPPLATWLPNKVFAPGKFGI